MTPTPADLVGATLLLELWTSLAQLIRVGGVEPHRVYTTWMATHKIVQRVRIENRKRP